jgi:hypothetical protein
MERTDCIYFERTIPKSGDERAVGFRCLAGIPTLGGCPPDCDRYTTEED